jgi:LAS superfamily LD-carboxypeptidase LdcB
MYNDDGELGRRRQYNNRMESSTKAVRGNFEILYGKIVGLIGAESYEHKGFNYQVELIDTGQYILCRRLLPYASYEGVGVYHPMEVGDPVVVAVKNGVMRDGLILGSFFTEGNYEEFYVDGLGGEPTQYNQGTLRQMENNAPSVHPNRVAQPDSFFHIVGGKNVLEAFHDPSLTDGSIDKRALKRNQPVSIELKNRLGDWSQWVSGDAIIYSDQAIILASSMSGASICKKQKEMVEYYEQMAKDLESYLSDSRSYSPIDLSQGVTGLISVTTEGNIPLTSELDEDKRVKINKSKEHRLRRYINGYENPDFLQWAPFIEYHLVEIKRLAEEARKGLTNCKESEYLVNRETEVSKEINKELPSNDQCQVLSDNGAIDDKYIESLAEHSICKKGNTKHYPYVKWKANKEDLVKLDSLAIKGKEERLIHKDIVTPLKELFDKAKKVGINLAATSSYRDEDTLEDSNKRTCTDLDETSIKSVAPYTHSEHITGYALDIVDRDDASTHSLDSKVNSKAWEWLGKNLKDSDFELSFPKDNKQGVNYEPWHIRYIGDKLPKFLAVMFAYTRGNTDLIKELVGKLCKDRPPESNSNTNKGKDRSDLDIDLLIDKVTKANPTLVSDKTGIHSFGVIGKKTFLSKKAKESIGPASIIKLNIALAFDSLMKGTPLTQLKRKFDISKFPIEVIAEGDSFNGRSVFLLENLVEAMLKDSSNTATNILFLLLGERDDGRGNSVFNRDKSNETLKGTSPSTEFNRLLSSTSEAEKAKDTTNKSTTEDALNAMYKLAISNVPLTKEISIPALGEAERPSGLQKVELNKIGWNSYASGNVCLYKGKKGRFVIGGFTNYDPSKETDYDLKLLTQASNLAIKALESGIEYIEQMEIEGF